MSFEVRPLTGETWDPLAAPVQAEAAFTGTLPMFERAGFRVVADRASDPSSARQRVVVRRELGST